MNPDTVCVCGHSKEDHKSDKWIAGRYEPTGKCNHVNYNTSGPPIPCSCFNYKNAETVKMLSKGTVIIVTGRKAGKSQIDRKVWNQVHENFMELMNKWKGK